MVVIGITKKSSNLINLGSLSAYDINLNVDSKIYIETVQIKAYCSDRLNTIFMIIISNACIKLLYYYLLSYCQRCLAFIVFKS